MTEQTQTLVSTLVQQYGHDRSRLMDVLRAVHAEHGCITEPTITEIAENMGLSWVEVADMCSFYAFFHQEPVGRHTVHICNAIVEEMHGADQIANAFQQELGISYGEITSDGMVSLHHTPCIGMSDQAPSALIDGTPITGLLPGDVPKLVQALKNGEPIDRLGEVAVNLRQPGAVIFASYEPNAGLRKALEQTPEQIIQAMNQARLRGRGGAGFPIALKWNFCRKAQGEAHYIICNADEGEPGTFKDRVILTECPDLLFEGMTIAGYAIGASQGFLYLRGEYAYLYEFLESVLETRRSNGWLGQNIHGKENFEFDIRIQLGAGAYICGEESALIESMEGKRGAPRDRPPFPVQKGFLGQPTAVNNVETLCCVPRIMDQGVSWFTRFGTRDSSGTKLLSISGDCETPGVYEVEFGVSIEQILAMVGAEDAQAVQMGGPSGVCLAAKDFGRVLAFEDVSTGGSVIVFGPQRDLLHYMGRFIEFFEEESCGWCVPCRVGTTMLNRKMKKVLAGKASNQDIQELENLAKSVKTMSRCGLGQTAGNPILSTLQNFTHLYTQRIRDDAFVPAFDLSKAIQAGCDAAGRTKEGALHV